jgi:hypothetical protein
MPTPVLTPPVVSTGTTQDVAAMALIALLAPLGTPFASVEETVADTASGLDEITTAAPAVPSPLPSLTSDCVAPDGNVRLNSLPAPCPIKPTTRGLPSSEENNTDTVAVLEPGLCIRIAVLMPPDVIAPSVISGK